MEKKQTSNTERLKALLNLSNYKPSALECAVSLEIARSISTEMFGDKRPSTEVLMCISNAFTSGIAYAHKHFSAKDTALMEEHFKECIRRIVDADVAVNNAKPKNKPPML